MTFTTCRQCGKTIPANSVRCPTCDIVNPGKRDFFAAGVTLIVVLGVFYAGWRTVAWITTPSEAPPSLAAEVRFTDSQIQIENNDTYEWTLCTITLNSGIVRGSWSQDLGRIPAGDTGTLLSGFSLPRILPLNQVRFAGKRDAVRSMIRVTG